MADMFSNKTAIISGGAGGIGLALATELGSQGMNVVIADIDEKQLAASEGQLRDKGIKVLGCSLDVTDYTQWQSVVEKAKAHFGDIHMLINNAGVGGIPGTIEDTDHQTWRWVIDVNLMGVLYGTQAVTPALKKHGQGGWIINVASMAGMGGVPYAGAYCATKAAVVSMTESWAGELKAFGIKVSALCPAFVKTRIHESLRNRQDKYSSAESRPVDKEKLKSGMNKAAALVEDGISTETLAKRVVEALQNNQLYIFTHPNYRPVTQERSAMIDHGFKDAENSEHVAFLKDQEITSL